MKNNDTFKNILIYVSSICAFFVMFIILSKINISGVKTYGLSLIFSCLALLFVVVLEKRMVKFAYIIGITEKYVRGISNNISKHLVKWKLTPSMLVYVFIVTTTVVIDYFSRNMLGRRPEQLIPILAYVLVGVFVGAVRKITISDRAYKFLEIVLIIFGVFFSFFSIYRPRLVGSQNWDYSAYWTSVLQLFNSVPFDKSASSFYGHYAFVLLPIFKLIGLSLESVAFVQGVENIIIFLCMFYTLRAMCKHTESVVVGLWFLIFFYQRYIFVYPQTMPHRIIPTAFMLFFLAWLNRDLKKRKCFIIAVVCVVSIIWNFECGIANVIAFSFYYFFRKKTVVRFLFSIGFLPMSVLAAWITTGVLNVVLTEGGHFLGIKEFLIPFFYTEGYVESISSPVELGSWVVVVPIFLVFAFSVLIVKNNSWGVVYSSIAVNALIVAVYFFNRAAWGNFYSIVILQFIVLIVAIYDYSCEKTSEISIGIRKGLLFFAALYMAIFCYRYKEWQNILENQQNANDMKQIAQEIVNSTSPNTIVFASSQCMLCIADERLNCYYYNIVNRTDPGREMTYNDIDINKPNLLLDGKGLNRIRSYFGSHGEEFDDSYAISKSFDTNPDDDSDSDLYLYEYIK